MKLFPQVYGEALSYFPVRRVLLYHPPSTTVALVLKQHGYTLVTEHAHPLLFSQHESFLRGPGAMPRLSRRLDRLALELHHLMQKMGPDWKSLVGWILENTVFPERGLLLFLLEKAYLYTSDRGLWPPPEPFWKGLARRLRLHLSASELPHVVLPEGYPPRCYRSLAEAIIAWLWETPPSTPLDEAIPGGTYFFNARWKVLRYYPIWVLHLCGQRAQIQEWETDLRSRRPLWRQAHLYTEADGREHWILVGWEEKV